MKNKKILICDDNHDNLDTLALFLEFEGYSVIKEIDSTKLIDKIKDDKPDILLIDILMPKVKGDEIIRRIRADYHLKELPIIVFSAMHDIEKIAIEAGADDFIGKPFDIYEIIESMRKLLNVNI